MLYPHTHTSPHLQNRGFAGPRRSRDCLQSSRRARSMYVLCFIRPTDDPLHLISPYCYRPFLVPQTLAQSFINHFTPLIKKLSLGGRLEDALAQYKRSNDFGVDRAAMHIRNVNISPPLSIVFLSCPSAAELTSRFDSPSASASF